MSSHHFVFSTSDSRLLFAFQPSLPSLLPLLSLTGLLRVFSGILILLLSLSFPTTVFPCLRLLAALHFRVLLLFFLFSFSPTFFDLFLFISLSCPPLIILLRFPFSIFLCPRCPCAPVFSPVLLFLYYICLCLLCLPFHTYPFVLF